MRSVKVSVALLSAAALLFTACGGDDSKADSTATTASGGTGTGTGGSTGTAAPVSTDKCTADKAGGTLTWANSINFTSGLDPIVALGRVNAGGVENSAIYDNLMVFDPAQKKIVPHLAESLTVNADFTVWTLKLRPNVKFGNGDPLTVDAVKFSVERLAKSTVGSSAMAAEVASMTVVDPLTLTFTLKRPWATFDYFLTAEGGMPVNPKVVTELGAKFAAGPIGAGVGPYEVVRFVPGQEVVLKGKKDYWGGPVCLDTLRFIPIPGAQAAYDAFKTKQIDVVFLQDARVIAQAKKDKVVNYDLPVAGSNSLMINQGVKGSTPPTKDVNLRLAIAHALDIKAINDRVYDGTGLASTKVFTDGVMDGPAYDQTAARDFVAKAKTAGWNGSVRLTCSNTPEATDFSIAVQAQLEAVGIKVVRENLPQPEVNARLLTKPDYDIGCMGLSTPALGSISAINQWASTSTRNRVGVANPALDAAIADIMKAPQGPTLVAAQNAFQKIWNETIPSAMTFGQDWFNGYDPAVVKGLVFTRDSIPLFYQAYKAK